ncbi:MAG: tRNA-dihydrouridine synthase [Candidatus Woesearchaeota archaeon]|nr:MAG: tRNA-dihydrouridine synthase [Candidatus Woesearchaeota archaeon]
MKLPKFKSRFFLAPMSGITDPAFRLLCSELGAGLTTTELTSIHAITHKGTISDIREFVQYSEKESPRSIQLFGFDIEKTIKAAKIVEPYFDIIDFNMGCPADHITAQQAGAALLQKPEHVKELFSKLVKSVDKPVTVKVRAGISNDSCYLFKNIARIAEESGVSMITLHARTLKQGYSGNAQQQWTWIKELKELVSIPVVGNGDVKSPEDAERMIKETGCDYVMIGRAAQGNPYIFKQLNDYFEKGTYNTLNDADRISYFFKYLEYTKDYNISFSRIKDHAMDYTKGMIGGSKLRKAITITKDINELTRIFNKLFKQII